MERSYSVLVVHGHQGARQSLRLCLEAGGARVLGVRALDAALDALAHGSFDVVLIAIAQHAELDAIAELVRARPAIGVVVLAEVAAFELAVEAMRRGARDCVAAPYHPEAVRAAASRARAGRDAAPRPEAHIPEPLAPGAEISLEALEREHIARIIARSPTLERAARTLGIDPTTLQRKRKRYGLA